MQYKLNSKIEDRFTSLAIKEIFALLKQVIDEKKLKDLEIIYPPEREMGNFTLPCFVLAKNFKKSPVKISKELSKNIKLKKSGIIRAVKNQGPYLNFFINENKSAELILNEIFLKKDKIGEYKIGKNKRMMIEYSQPNTHKEFHIGHLRNVCIGSFLVNIYRLSGYKVIAANYIGDIGAHIAKCIWGWNNLLSKEQINLAKSGDNKLKVKYLALAYSTTDQLLNSNNDKNRIDKIKKEISDILKKLELGDKKLTAFWKMTRKWSLDLFDEIYQELNIKFDVIFYESEEEKPGKKIVQKFLQKKIAKKSEDAIIVDLKKYNLNVFLILKSDGTSLYATKDLALAQKKYKKYKIDKSLYVVDARQSLYFKQLFKTLELAGFKQEMVHLGYEFVKLPSGAISSRSGNIISYKDLKMQIFNKTKQETEKRHKDWTSKKIETVANIITNGAIKFEMIKIGIDQIIIFDINQSLKFNGFTAAYLQYTYARIMGIIQKSEVGSRKSDAVNVDFSKLSDKSDADLIFELSKFSNIIKQAGENYDPSILAKYLYELAKLFHNFYHQSPVIQADKETKKARILLIFCVAQIIKKGLDLLGIEVLEEM